VKNDPQAVADALDALQAAGRRRIRRVVQGFAAPGTAAKPLLEGRPLLNFCSNDYLDLARDPGVARAMAEAQHTWSPATAPNITRSKRNSRPSPAARRRCCFPPATWPIPA